MHDKYFANPLNKGSGNFVAQSSSNIYLTRREQKYLGSGKIWDQEIFRIRKYSALENIQHQEIRSENNQNQAIGPVNIQDQ